jgi:hypothetical protein
MVDDATDPAGLVARRKTADNRVDMRLLEGGDTEINRGLHGLVIGITLAGGLTQFMAAQQALFAAQSVNMTPLIDAAIAAHVPVESDSLIGPVMAFGKMTEDASAPAGMIARRKQDESVVLDISHGGDTEVNRGLHGIAIGITLAGGLTDFMLAQQAMFTAQSVDITALIDASIAGDDWMALVA